MRLKTPEEVQAYRDWVFQHLDGIQGRRESDQVKARCPLHNDGTASLSIRVVDGVAKCHAGCEFPNGTLRGLAERMGIDPPAVPKKPKSDIVATYDYLSEAGEPLRQKVRMEPKDFRWKLWCTATMQFVWPSKASQADKDRARKTLYNLPNLVEYPDDVVFYVEGEKDVDTLEYAFQRERDSNPRALGKLAVTCGGAEDEKAFPADAWAALAGRRVAVVPDTDKPGRAQGERIASRLHALGCEVKVLDLATPLDGQGKDVSDLYHARPEDLVSILRDLWRSSPLWSPPAVVPGTDGEAEGEPGTGKGKAGPKKAPSEYPLTDTGNAELLFDRFGKDVRFVPEMESWVIYSNGVWRRDRHKTHLGGLAIKTARLRQAEADGKAEQAHALKSEGATQCSAMLTQLGRMPQVEARLGQFDANPWILNVRNGTLDLKAQTLRPFERSDLCTRQAPVSYDVKAQCPTWLNFLQTCMEGNQEKIDYLQRWAGYCLTGDVGEHKLAIFEGAGRNGKGTFGELLLAMLGLTQGGTDGIPGYAHKAAFEMFLETKEQKTSGAASPDLAALRGARYVLASEAAEKRTLAETKVKELTGGDTVNARPLYQEVITFNATHKFVLLTNEKPRITGTDEGIWSRLDCLKWERVFEEHERDKELGTKLRAELPGILNWCLAGLKSWLAQGLATPAVVRGENQAYRAAMDQIQGFLDAHCIVRKPASVTSKEVYLRYQEYCTEQGERYETAKWLANKLQRKGFHLDRRHGNVGFWEGLELRPKYTEKPPDDDPEPAPRVRHVPVQASLDPNWDPGEAGPLPGAPDRPMTYQESQDARRAQAPRSSRPAPLMGTTSMGATSGNYTGAPPGGRHRPPRGALDDVTPDQVPL